MEPMKIEPKKESLVDRVKDVFLNKLNDIKEAIQYHLERYRSGVQSSLNPAYATAGQKAEVYGSFELATEMGKYTLNQENCQCQCDGCDRCHRCQGCHYRD